MKTFLIGTAPDTLPSTRQQVWGDRVINPANGRTTLLCDVNVHVPTVFLLNLRQNAAAAGSWSVQLGCGHYAEVLTVAPSATGIDTLTVPASQVRISWVQSTGTAVTASSTCAPYFQK